MKSSDQQILRINMATLEAKFSAPSEELRLLGGRGLTSTIVGKEVPPLCNPLGASNKIIIAPGIVTGSRAPSSGRLSVGAKSPLTGGIKEANAGGRSPAKLSKAGYKAVVIEGLPSDADAWYNIVLKKGDAQIVQANEYAGMGAYEMCQKLYGQYSNKPGIIGTGIAGQQLLSGAGIFGNNVENTDPGRYAGRGGLGAVMGSKRVLAVITDDSDGSTLEPVDGEKFKTAIGKLREALEGHALTGKDGGLQNYGTSLLTNILNEAGAYPTKNWTSGHFEGAAKISGEAAHEAIDKAKEAHGDATDATYAHACNPGCVMKCSNVIPRPDGTSIVSPLEYESAWALGACTIIDNLEHVAELNRVCNDLGLDTIEAGNALGIAMEAGIVPWGDGPAAIELLKEVGKGTPMGKILGSGALTTGNVLGIKRVAHVKGQSLPAYDPRAIKGIGVTYATGPMGGDHTQGYTIAAEIAGIKGEVTDPRLLEKAGLSRAFQETTAYIDSSGYCLFIAFAILDVDDGFAGMADSVAAMYGTDWKGAEVTEFGRKVLNTELDFNRRAGFTKEHDRLPEFFHKEAIAPHNVVFDVSDEELDKVHYG